MIEIVSFSIKDRYSNTSNEFLRGAIGDRMTAEITYDVHWEVEEIEIEAKGFGFKDPSAALFDVFIRQDGGDFLADGFRDDDLIDVTGFPTAANNGSFTVKKVTTIKGKSALAITTSGTLTASETDTDISIFGQTLVVNHRFFDNLIRNSDSINFTSLVTDTIRAFSAGSYDVNEGSDKAFSPLAISNFSSLDVIDSDNYRIEALSIFGTNHQRFKITRIFYIIPFFLDGELDPTTKELIFPNVDYLFDNESLRFVFEISARYAGQAVSDVVHTTAPTVDLGNSSFGSLTNGDQFQKSGDVGWYDEVFNGNDKKYELDSITYTESASGNPLTSKAANVDTDVDIRLTSLDSTWDDGVSKSIIIVHIFQAVSESEYRPISGAGGAPDFASVLQNFRYDTVKLDLGAGALGTGGEFEGVIDVGAEATKISATEAQVTFKLLASKYSDEDQDYIIYASCFDTNSTSLNTSDLTAVLVDTATVSTFQDLPTVFEIDGSVEFSEHESNASASATADVKGWVEDGIYTSTVFKTLTTDANNDFSLSQVVIRIEAEHISDSTKDFLLQEEIFDISTLVPVANILVDTTQNFFLDVGDLKNIIKLERRTDLDVGDFEFYQLQYGFKFRWEEWRSLGLNLSDFPNPKHNWDRYSQDANYSLKFNIYASVEVTPNASGINSFIQEFKHTSDLEINSYDQQAGAVNYTATIETFTEDGISNAGGKIIATENTRVKVTLTGDTDPPGSLYGILELDAELVGGERFIRHISTLSDNEDSSPWIGITTAKRVDLTINLGPHSAILEAVLDFTKLSVDIETFKLSARLGEITGAPVAFNNQFALGGSSGIPGNELDGADDHLDVRPILSDITASATGTWATWIFPINIGVTTYFMSLGHDPGSGFLGNKILILGFRSNHIVMACGTEAATGIAWEMNASVTATPNSGNGLTVNAWNHVIARHDGVEGKIYVGGVLFHSNFQPAGPSLEDIRTKWAPVIAPSLQNVILGARISVAGIEQAFPGRMDESVFFDTALTDGGVLPGAVAGGEIAELYNLGIPFDINTHSKAVTNLSGYFRMESESGGIVSNSSTLGAGKNGTLKNGAAIVALTSPTDDAIIV